MGGCRARREVVRRAGAASPARGSRHGSQALVVRAVRAKWPASGTRHVSQSLGASLSATEMGWMVVGPARCLGVPPGRRPDRASTVGAHSRDVASRFSFDEGFRSVGTNARPPEGLPTYPGHSAILARRAETNSRRAGPGSGLLRTPFRVLRQAP